MGGVERPYDGCGKCLLGVRRLSRMKAATSSPERQRDDVLAAAGVDENRFTVVAFLAGPPGLGYLGDHVVLRPAMLVILACAAFLGPGVEIRPRTGCRSVRARRSRREPSHG